MYTYTCTRTQATLPNFRRSKMPLYRVCTQRQMKIVRGLLFAEISDLFQYFLNFQSADLIFWYLL